MLPAEVANQNEQADLKQPLAELFSIHATTQKAGRGGKDFESNKCTSCLRTLTLANPSTAFF